MMEYSIAIGLEGQSEVYSVPVPHLISAPATDHVTPGIAQIVNTFESIVPLRPGSYVIEKQVAPEFKSIEQNSDIPNQMGLGTTKINPPILESLQHPIVTDAIIFPKDVAKKRKIESQTLSNQNKKPKLAISHKFQIE